MGARKQKITFVQLRFYDPNGHVVWPLSSDMELALSSRGFDHHPSAIPLPMQKVLPDLPIVKTRMIDGLGMIIVNNERRPGYY